ncbi:MAG: OmpA family protein [Terracidiphilus sp.]
MKLCLPIFLLAIPGLLSAQVPNPTTEPRQSNMQRVPYPATEPPQSNMQQVPSQRYGGEPLYKIQVVGRYIPAINYFHRSGSTKIGFQGTSLLPHARGWAKVDALKGRTTIDVNLQGITPANGFGPEYLTYVLWAITPQGRPVNLGEVLPTGSNNKTQMTVTTDLQAFGLVVTAEPYYAVTMPSDVVVLQNYVLNDKTQGIIEPVNAHYFLLPRGAYTETAGRHSVLNPITRDERSPLELYEAINAVRIAEAAGAGQYAAGTMASAKTALLNAREIDAHEHDRKQTVTYAREAVQDAEDARIITIRKLKAADEMALKQSSMNAEQAAQQAQQEAQQQAEARRQAEAEADQARQAQQQAEQNAQRAEQNAEQARAGQEQSAQQTEQMRERLREQLNRVLQTRETARGLIVNMPDVLFATNRYNLKPDAREKLAKISGILLAYPGLQVHVEGYTDSTGAEGYNLTLSDERAKSVADYLIAQSVPSTDISATGYGESDPIASNSTSAGRSENRRVQLVVSGAAIGLQPGQPGAEAQPPEPASEPYPSRNADVSRVPLPTGANPR